VVLVQFRTVTGRLNILKPLEAAAVDANRALAHLDAEAQFRSLMEPWPTSAPAPGGRPIFARV